MNASVTSQAEAPEDLVELGRIISAYGVRGWIKVQPHSSNAQVLLAAKTWWLKAPAPLGESGVSSLAFPSGVVACRTQGATVVAELAHVRDRDHAESMKGHTVWVSRTEFPAAEDDEFYWVDLIGCQLYGEHNHLPMLIGTVADVTDNGAHAVLRVTRHTADDSGNIVPVLSDKGKPLEVLVPFVLAHVHTVDIANKRLDSNWPVEL